MSESTEQSAVQSTAGRVAAARQVLPIDGLPTLNALVEHLQLQQWDTIIIGDGSGCGWDMATGWSAVLIDHYSNARKLFYGAVNTGTITLGELWPYLHALSWYTGKDGPGRARRKDVNQLGRNLAVHLVTDSEVTAKAGNNPAARRSHFEFWAAFDAYAAQGYALTFHFVPRDTINLNVLVDQISRQARIDLTHTYDNAIAELQKRYPGLPTGVSIYDFSQ